MRIGAGAIAVAVQLAIGYALLTGLSVHLTDVAADPLKLFQVAPPAPPPPPERLERKRMPSVRREGAAAPPNIKSKATALVAPPPIVVTTVPPPVIATKVANTGAQATSGAAKVVGPGTGAGGIGNGTGSGGSGNGSGGGGISEPARLLKGAIRNKDYPREAARRNISGEVTIRYTITAQGTPANCRIVKSSGSPILDAGTCDLVIGRMRYAPARDADGRAVASSKQTTHGWYMYDGPGPTPQAVQAE